MRRAVLALALLAFAAGLTACGGVTKTVDPVAAAATKTQDSGGYKAATTVTVSAAGKQLTMTGHGSFASNRGEMDMDLGGLLGALGGGSGADSTMKAIYLTEGGDHVMYLNLAFLSSMLPGGKSWIRIDLEKAGKAAGIDVNQLMSGAGQNPSDSLALLRTHGDFSEVGTEKLDGVDTTHYHGTVDLQKAAAASGAGSDAIKRILELGGPSQYPVDVWVDDAGYVRQYETSYDQTSNGSPMSMSMKVEIGDYGTNVDVTAPPADQTFDATELAAKGASSQLGQGTTG